MIEKSPLDDIMDIAEAWIIGLFYRHNVILEDFWLSPRARPCYDWLKQNSIKYKITSLEPNPLATDFRFKKKDDALRFKLVWG
jgi:hypothetical protein